MIEKLSDHGIFFYPFGNIINIDTAYRISTCQAYLQSVNRIYFSPNVVRFYRTAKIG